MLKASTPLPLAMPSPYPRYFAMSKFTPTFASENPKWASPGGAGFGQVLLSLPGGTPSLKLIYMEKWKKILAFIIKLLIAILSVIGGGGQIAQSF